jgi:hypothetical protein
VRLHDVGHRRQNVRGVSVELPHRFELPTVQLAQYLGAVLLDEGFQLVVLPLPECGAARPAERVQTCASGSE